MLYNSKKELDNAYDDALNIRSDNEYHSFRGATSVSELKLVSKSLLTYHMNKIVPKERKEAFDKGTAVHCFFLEPDDFENQVAIIPESYGETLTVSEQKKRGVINPLSVAEQKKINREEWEKANENKAWIKEDFAKDITRMHMSLKFHPAADMLINDPGNQNEKVCLTKMHLPSFFGFIGSEVNFESTDKDWWLMRSKLDIFNPDFDLKNYAAFKHITPATDLQGNEHPGFIADIKTCDDASPDGIKKTLANFDYKMQASCYRMSKMMETGGIMYPFIFIFVEKKFPHHWNYRVLDESYMEEGLKSLGESILRLRQYFLTPRMFLGYDDCIQISKMPAYEKMKDKPTGSTINMLEKSIDKMALAVDEFAREFSGTKEVKESTKLEMDQGKIRAKESTPTITPEETAAILQLEPEEKKTSTYKIVNFSMSDMGIESSFSFLREHYGPEAIDNDGNIWSEKLIDVIRSAGRKRVFDYKKGELPELSRIVIPALGIKTGHEEPEQTAAEEIKEDVIHETQPEKRVLKINISGFAEKLIQRFMKAAGKDAEIVKNHIYCTGEDICDVIEQKAYAANFDAGEPTARDFARAIIPAVEKMNELDF